MKKTVEIQNKKLQDLIRALKVKVPTARVGILGDEARAGKGGKTNAEIGVAHEFGTQTLPIRSFLRMPLSTQLFKKLQSTGAFNRNSLAEVAKEKSLATWVEKLAIIGEGVVQEAFSTGGFGQWPAWQNPNYTNNTGQLLIDSAQLRNSISSEVVE